MCGDGKESFRDLSEYMYNLAPVKRQKGICCETPSCEAGGCDYCMSCGQDCSACGVRPPLPAEELLKKRKTSDGCDFMEDHIR